MAGDKFKVIIVGAGPVGLTAAHALILAGIDFVVLEQRESIVLDEGASLVLGPNSLRVMYQLGLYDSLLAVGDEFRHQKVFTVNGNKWKDTTATLRLFKKCHGTAPMVFYRAELVQALYSGLPDYAKEEKILTSKKVVNMTCGKNGVEVACIDSTKYRGSIVLGADGVRSQTHRFMRDMALAASPASKWDVAEPFHATYRAIWCSFPRPSEPGQAFETQHKDRGLVYFTGGERGYVLMFEKLKSPYMWKPHYTDEDLRIAAASFDEFPVTEALKVKDVFANRQAAGMANLEEGIVKHWSWGRCVLAGDACHKLTPNSGLGFNNGVQDIVALCNGLHRAVAGAPDRNPDSSTLAAVFRRYESDRLKTIKGHAFVSTHLVRINSWANAAYYCVARYIMASKRIEYFTLKHVVSRFIKQGLVLDYVSVEEPFTAAVAWTHSTKK